MKRKSSIHIEQGKLGYLFHNDRTKPTANSIFSQENNEYDNDAKTAIEIYRQELQKRSEAYTKRTGKKLNKKTITHLSAIVNLDKQHNLEDVKEIAKHLEEELGTKVFQIAVHRDEGYVDENGTPHINYHAHLEMLGLDEQGNSVRRKLNRQFLINLQDKVSEILQMERGINYTAERKKRPKRLDTYEYKEHARRQAEKEKETLAKVKDLKEENKRLREELKQAHAKREHYAELEQFVKDLKEQVKAKELTIEQLKEQMQAKEKELLKKIQEKSEEILSVEKKQELLEQIKEKEEEIEHKNKTIEKLNNDVEELTEQVYSPYYYKNTNKLAPWSVVAKQRKKIIEQLKKEKEEERKRREKAEKKAEELKKQVCSDFVYRDTKEPISWQDLAKIYKKEAEEERKKNEEYKRKLEETQRELTRKTIFDCINGGNKHLEEEEIELYKSVAENLKQKNEELETENRRLKEENKTLKGYIIKIAQALQVNIEQTIEKVVESAISKAKGLFSKIAELTNRNTQLEQEIEEIKEQDDWNYGGGWKM